MATHSSIFAWKITWTEEPGGLQSMRSQRVGYDLVTKLRQWKVLLALSSVCEGKAAKCKTAHPGSAAERTAQGHTRWGKQISPHSWPRARGKLSECPWARAPAALSWPWPCPPGRTSGAPPSSVLAAAQTPLMCFRRENQRKSETHPHRSGQEPGTGEKGLFFPGSQNWNFSTQLKKKNSRRNKLTPYFTFCKFCLEARKLKFRK